MLTIVAVVGVAAWVGDEGTSECTPDGGDAVLAPLAIGRGEPVWAIPEELPEGMQVEDTSNGRFRFSTPLVTLYGPALGDPLDGPRIAVIAASGVGYRVPGGREISIHGSTGTAGRVSDAEVVEWSDEPDSTTVVAGWQVSREDVLCVATSLERTARGVRIPAGSLPRGMQPLAQGDLAASPLVLLSRHPRYATRIRAVGPRDRELTIFASRGNEKLASLAQLFVDADNTVEFTEGGSTSVARVRSIDDVTVLVVAHNVDSSEMDDLVQGLRLSPDPDLAHLPS